MRRALAALVIVALTGLAIRAIAARKNEDLAGPGSYRLPPPPAPERAALDALLAELERLEQHELASRLRALDTEGRLWVSPFMPGQRQAVYVSSLGLIERIYVDRAALLVESPPFPDQGLPDDWRRLYAVLRLGGTLFHELQHLDGELDESVVYQREAGWYGELRRAGFARGLGGEPARRYRWAIESTLLSARKAAESAAQQAGSGVP